MALDDESEEESTKDEAEDSASDIETVHTERDASLQSTVETSDLDSGPTKSIDTSGPWYDGEEGRYIDEPDQTSVLPPMSKSLPNHCNEHVSNITAEPAPYYPTRLLNGNNEWIDASMAELEEEVELALLEEVNSSSTSAPGTPRHSVNPPQDEMENQEHTETTDSRSEELQDTSRHATGLEEWERQGTGEVGFHTGQSRCLQSPSTTNFEIYRTLTQVDYCYPTTLADNERHYALRTSQDPSATTVECLDAREEDSSGDSIDKDSSEDEDYTHDTGDEEEEDTRPANQQTSPLTPSNEVPTHWHPPASILNEQLHTPRPSRSTFAMSSELAAEYREWSFQAFLKV